MWIQSPVPSPEAINAFTFQSPSTIMRPTDIIGDDSPPIDVFGFFASTGLVNAYARSKFGSVGLADCFGSL
jgi:hypothetical protein